MKCTITITYETSHFDTTFTPAPHVKEYQLADEAWNLAVMFAETQAIAHNTTVADILRKLDYSYILEKEH